MKMKIERVEDVQVGDVVTIELAVNAEKHGMVEAPRISGTVTRVQLDQYCHSISVGPFSATFSEFESSAKLLSATREVSDQPDLPTEPGYYFDKDGDVWWLASGKWWCFEAGEFSNICHVRHYSPFTRLIPETELVEQRKKIAQFIRTYRSEGLTEPEKQGCAGRVELGEF